MSNEHTPLKEGDQITVTTKGVPHIATVLGKEILEDGDFVHIKIDDESDELFLLMIVKDERIVVKKAVSVAESPSG